MLSFAWTAISSSSAAPLRLTALAGLLLSALGAACLAYILCVTLMTHATVPGWRSLAALQVLFSGIILLAIGLVGDYLSRVYEEARARPLYVVAHSHNVAQPPTCARAVWLTPRPADNEIAGKAGIELNECVEA
jgi:dolichol-phosphate mannosyltransferase